MEVKDLQANQGNVNIEVEIVEKGDVREFEKFGRAGRVCTAVAKDGSGQIKLTLWNEDIDKVNAGDKVKLTNGYVSEWQGELQLTTGKFGKLEVAARDETPAAAEDTAEAPAEVAEEGPEPKQQQAAGVDLGDVEEEEVLDE